MAFLFVAVVAFVATGHFIAAGVCAAACFLALVDKGMKGQL
jgi:hypothetical protein